MCSLSSHWGEARLRNAAATRETRAWGMADGAAHGSDPGVDGPGEFRS
ncbi:MAG: hypothetical protein ACKOFW_06380 [Planctomycetaceae bacterium]